MRLLLSSLGFISCLLASAWAGESTAPVVTAEKALVEMLTRVGKEDAFVVVEDKTTAQFIQYGCDEQGLFIDIPLLKRTDDEKERLAAVFRSIGIMQPVVNSSTDVTTRKPVMIRSYQAGFARDARKAATFGFRVFREAYLLKKIDLLIETD